MATSDLQQLLERARSAIGSHDPVKASTGRCNCMSCRTGRLATRGWPSAVTGDGSGVRSTSTSSSTERAALAADSWTTLHDRAGVHLARLRTELLAVLAIAAIVDSHASDDDVVPAGTGACACGCGHFCDPRKDQEDRLKSKLAPTCHRRWLRWRSAYPGVVLSDFVDACHRERGETRAQPVAEARAS